jgi:hypothetical protein
MTKRAKRDINTFKRVQQCNGKYHISPFSVQEQAIREHVRRGYSDPRAHVPGLLSQENKI